jgi:hypothetical protein
MIRLLGELFVLVVTPAAVCSALMFLHVLINE